MSKHRISKESKARLVAMAKQSLEDAVVLLINLGVSPATAVELVRGKYLELVGETDESEQPSTATDR